MRSRQLEPAAAVALSAGGRLDLGVRFEGFGPGVDQQGERLLDLGRRAGAAAERLDEAGARGFWERHDRLRAAGPLRAKLAAPPASLPAVVRDATDPLLRTLQGGGFAWYPTLGLGFATGGPTSAEAVRAAVQQARAALHGLGGSLVLAAAPREVRAVVDVWGPPPPAVALMRSLKARLDPERRLAPGRFVGGI
jgi:glycolate oxidase FAD binding subunit